MNIFLNIKNPYKNKKFSWCYSNECEILLDDNIFKKYYDNISLPLIYKRLCKFNYFQDHENDEKHYIDIECYHLTYKVDKYLKFLYIPKKDIDNFIRKQKIKNII